MTFKVWVAVDMQASRLEVKDDREFSMHQEDGLGTKIDSAFERISELYPGSKFYKYDDSEINKNYNNMKSKHIFVAESTQFSFSFSFSPGKLLTAIFLLKGNLKLCKDVRCGVEMTHFKSEAFLRMLTAPP